MGEGDLCTVAFCERCGSIEELLLGAGLQNLLVRGINSCVVVLFFYLCGRENFPIKKFVAFVYIW